MQRWICLCSGGSSQAGAELHSLPPSLSLSSMISPKHQFCRSLVTRNPCLFCRTQGLGQCRVDAAASCTEAMASMGLGSFSSGIHSCCSTNVWCSTLQGQKTSLRHSCRVGDAGEGPPFDLKAPCDLSPFPIGFEAQDGELSQLQI